MGDTATVEFVGDLPMRSTDEVMVLTVSDRGQKLALSSAFRRTGIGTLPWDTRVAVADGDWQYGADPVSTS